MNMMKVFVVVSALVALCGFNFVSSASIDSRENETPATMEVYKIAIERMLKEASKKISENVVNGEKMDLDNFSPENIFDADQSDILIEEESEEQEADDNEISEMNEDQSSDDVDSGIRCGWHGTNGQCCQTLRIIRIRISICLGIQIHVPSSMRLYLRINGRTIWARTAGIHTRSYHVCLRKGIVKMCFHLYGLSISPHYARVCLKVEARLGWIRYRHRLGCISKRFALQENQEIPNKIDSSNLSQKQNEGLFANKQESFNDDIFRFEQ